jgi:hypothetical protein
VKTWTISLCHNDTDIIADSLEQRRKTIDPAVEDRLLMVDQHWPIDYPKTRANLEAIARDHGATLLDPGKNLGLHHGFNWALEQVGIPDNAMVVGYDPDSWPLTPGWNMAMCRAFVADPRVVWLSLWHTHSERELNAETKGLGSEILDGVRVRELRVAAMNSICGFRRGWLRAVGGLREPSLLYGGLEICMWDEVKKHGRWVFLEDYREDLRMHDRVNPLYKEWKWDHAHRGVFHGSFEEWLRSKGKL